MCAIEHRILSVIAASSLPIFSEIDAPKKQYIHSEIITILYTYPHL